MIIFAVLLTACGTHDTKATPSTPGTFAEAAAITLVIKGSEYQPATFTVPPGSRVTVRNDDPTIHTVTADNMAFNTGNVTRGLPVTFTAPTEPGRYPYHCMFHNYIKGVLNVS